MLRKLRSLGISVAVTIILILGVDFLLTKLGMGPQYFMVLGVHNISTAVLESAHPVFHHELLPNIDGNYDFGNGPIRLCTNSFGFKISCADKDKTPRKDYDVAFIGDSFTEALGCSYEDSFVGRYARRHPSLAVANLGARSYSPSIFYKKIQYLLDNGFTFKHIVVLPDISDIQDEATWYIVDADGRVVNKPADLVNPEDAAPKSLRGKIRSLIHSIRDELRSSFSLTNFLVRRIRMFLFDKPRTVPGLEKPYARSAWTYAPSAAGYGAAGVAGGIAQALDSMRKLKELLDAHNITMTIVVYPWPDQLAHDKPDHLGMTLWRDFCIREHCAGFIDANRIFFEQVAQLGLHTAVSRFYIQNDTHFNAEGNRLLFEAIDAGLRADYY
jgi:hypothetical protein